MSVAARLIRVTALRDAHPETAALAAKSAAILTMSGLRSSWLHPGELRSRSTKLFTRFANPFKAPASLRLLRQSAPQSAPPRRCPGRVL